MQTRGYCARTFEFIIGVCWKMMCFILQRGITVFQDELFYAPTFPYLLLIDTANIKSGFFVSVTLPFYNIKKTITHDFAVHGTTSKYGNIIFYKFKFFEEVRRRFVNFLIIIFCPIISLICSTIFCPNFRNILLIIFSIIFNSILASFWAPFPAQLNASFLSLWCEYLKNLLLLMFLFFLPVGQTPFGHRMVLTRVLALVFQDSEINTVLEIKKKVFFFKF